MTFLLKVLIYNLSFILWSVISLETFVISVFLIFFCDPKLIFIIFNQLRVSTSREISTKSLLVLFIHLLLFLVWHVDKFPFCLCATSRICNSHYDSHIVFGRVRYSIWGTLVINCSYIYQNLCILYKLYRFFFGIWK